MPRVLGRGQGCAWPGRLQACASLCKPPSLSAVPARQPRRPLCSPHMAAPPPTPFLTCPAAAFAFVLLCPLAPAGEKSLSVTIEEGSEKAVWNCFRAKCGWTGGVNTRQGINKAYRQFTNDAGAWGRGWGQGAPGVVTEAALLLLRCRPVLCCHSIPVPTTVRPFPLPCTPQALR